MPNFSLAFAVGEASKERTEGSPERRPKHRAVRVPIIGVLLVLICMANACAGTLGLVPATYADFDYYTFALTWQPGICGIDDGPLIGPGRHERCRADQPHTPLIGLHGLWPSRPQALIKADVRVQRWWSRGCDLLHHSGEEPDLSPDLRAKLAVVMPQLRDSLLAHEYDKHVQCFGFDPARFFSTALAMRSVVADAPFGRFLAAHRGAIVAHGDVVAAFEQSFGTTDARAVQLQCARAGPGPKALTQIWITIRASRIGAFPAPASLTHTPIDQDTCPATVLLPAW